MQKLNISLKNCYGISAIEHSFDFQKRNGWAVYAPNGVMKTSFAQVFSDIRAGSPSSDRIFRDRITERVVQDEDGRPLSKEDVFVIRPYDEEFDGREQIAVLLVNEELRREYEELQAGVHRAKQLLFKKIKETSKISKVEQELCSVFERSLLDLSDWLFSVQPQVEQSEDELAAIPYDLVFNDKVATFLKDRDLSAALDAYSQRYNEVIAESNFFKKAVFNYHQAGTVTDALDKNGFFDAKHVVRLKSNSEEIEIDSAQKLQEIIDSEKQKIFADGKLQDALARLDQLIVKNEQCRAFQQYVLDNQSVLPRLTDLAGLRRAVLLAHLKKNSNEYVDFVREYTTAELRRREIEQSARDERTQWQEVVEIFNSRFIVPFRLSVKDFVGAVLGKHPVPTLEFEFSDGRQTKTIDKYELLQVLSQGERKALYILNILFEVEARKKSGQRTLFIVDDIADSFDYRNKYAIIEYLKEIFDDARFRQLILTHNFDFFRTVSSRIVGQSGGLLARKSDDKIELRRVKGVDNLFVREWKNRFFEDDCTKVACIPFMRNLIEFTRGNKDESYSKLTSLLHVKPDSEVITISHLDAIFRQLFPDAVGASPQPDRKAINVLHQAAHQCLGDHDSFNLECKVVLSIAIRYIAEQFMILQIDDTSKTANIKGNQTKILFDEFKKKFCQPSPSLDTLHKVVLVTPEIIHLNAFMYEPLIDLSDEHLHDLYKTVFKLAKEAGVAVDAGLDAPAV